MNWKGGKVTVECAACHKTIKAYPYRTNNTTYLFCSRECRYAFQKGKDPPGLAVFDRKSLGQRAIETGQLAQARAIGLASGAFSAGGKKGGATLAGIKKAHELHDGTGTYKSAGQKGGRVTFKKFISMRPNHPNAEEIEFYSYLIFGDIDFRCQDDSVTGGGIADASVAKVMAELDGDGHHAFGDRRKRDAEHDVLRTAMGFKIIRESEPFLLFLKVKFLSESDDGALRFPSVRRLI